MHATWDDGCVLHLAATKKHHARQTAGSHTHALPQHDTQRAALRTHRMCPLKVSAAARWLGTSTIATSGLLGLGSVSLLYLLGITNDIVTSPTSSFDSDSVPDMSMRTGELQDSSGSSSRRTQQTSRKHQHRARGGWRVPAHKKIAGRLSGTPSGCQLPCTLHINGGHQTHCRPACSSSRVASQPALPDPAAPTVAGPANDNCVHANPTRPPLHATAVC